MKDKFYQFYFAFMATLISYAYKSVEKKKILLEVASKKGYPFFFLVKSRDFR